MDRHTPTYQKQLYSRIIARIIIAALIFFGVVHFLPSVFSLIAPFFYALLLAAILNPLVLKLHTKFGWPRKLLALLLVVFVALSLLSVLGWLGYIAVNELLLLATNLDEIWESLSESLAFVGTIATTLLDFFPGDTDTFAGTFMDNAFDWINTAIIDLGNFLLTRTPAITTRVGSGVLDVIMFILASYFAIVEYPRLKKAVGKYSKGSIYKYLQTLKSATKVAVGGYLKAQFILSGITFILMLVVLILLGQDYAFILALLLAFLDFLPLIGTSIVLVPWGIAQIIMGNFWTGIFLVLLSWVCFFIRRIIEPKVMGTQTGLHPLMALLSIYVGLRAYSVWGAILGPIVVMVVLNLVKSGIFDSTIKDVKDVFRDLKRVFE